MLENRVHGVYAPPQKVTRAAALAVAIVLSVIFAGVLCVVDLIW